MIEQNDNTPYTPTRRDRSHLRLVPVVVPEETEWDEGAQRWAWIDPDWQDEMTELLEDWINKPDDSPDPVTLQEVGLAIRDYLAINGIRTEQAEYLRGVFRSVQQAQKAKEAKAAQVAAVADPELAAIFS